MQQHPTHKNASGFTLIELVIAVAVIGILTSVAVLGYNQYKVRAYDAHSKQALRDILLQCNAFWLDMDASQVCNHATVAEVYVASDEIVLKFPAEDLPDLPGGSQGNFCASAQHESSPNTYSIDSASLISDTGDCGKGLAAERAAAEKETKRLAELALADDVARNAGYKDAEEYEECFTNVLATNIELYNNYEACRFSESSFTVGHSSSCSQPLRETVRTRYGGMDNYGKSMNSKCRRESDNNLADRLMNTYTYRNCTDEKSRAYCVCIIRAHNKQYSSGQVIAGCARLSAGGPTREEAGLNQMLLHGFSVGKKRAEAGANLHFDTRPCVMLSTDETRCPHEQKCKGFARYSPMCK